MQTQLKKSIIVRIGFALVGIAVTALLSMFGSMLVVETIEGDAQAINLSGSMRMQAYRLLNAKSLNFTESQLNQLADEFDEKVNAQLLKHIVRTGDNTELATQLDEIRKHWYQQLRPNLHNPDLQARELKPMLDDFVDRIDRFVVALEESSASKIKLLRSMQGITMFIVVLVSFGILYRLHENMALPLRELVFAAQRIKDGDFENRTHYRGEDELGLLSNTFNQMASELTLLYNDLEQRVEQKTEELRRSNNILALLYEASKRLYSKPGMMHQSMPVILQRLEPLIGLGTVSLCLSRCQTGPAYQMITSNDAEKPSFCRKPNCDPCRYNPDKTRFAPHLHAVVTFPVGNGDHRIGELSIEVLKGQRIEDWQRDLLNTLADMIYTTDSLSSLADQEARIALMDERAVIARELHDSLAQSLSYQKMQATRLKKLLQLNADEQKIFDAIDQVQSGLNNSYRQLRELLSTFRIKIDTPGIEPAVFGTIAEFRDRTDIDLRLNYALTHCPLTPNEEIHCHQIIREALSNVIKHSQATQATVDLKLLDHGKVEIQIKDNGIGIEPSPEKANHYGMAILNERAESLGGKLTIQSLAEGGTLVRLEFCPAFMKQPVEVQASI